MRVLLDAHMLGAQEGGNETYIQGLLSGFEEIASGECLNILALCPPEYAHPVEAKPPVRRIPLNSQNDLNRVFYEIPRKAQQLQADIIHATYNASPFVQRPLLITVHDVIFRIFPEYFSPRVRLLLSTLMPLTMYRAKGIVTVSETSKRDIERFYPFTRGKVYVTYEAAGPVASMEPEYASVDPQWLQNDFILSVCTLQPRKNLERLLLAYIDGRRKGSIQAKLVLTGKAAWQHSELFSLAQSSGFASDIIFTGYVSAGVLAALYESCQIFVYPSLYEGFGLPVLEAMARGAPVVTSNNSALAEIAQDAALTVDPHSVDQIREAIESLLDNSSLRMSIIEKGRRQAKKFAWSQTAKQTVEIYRTISPST